MLCVVLFGMNLFVLFEILWALEGFIADFADVWLERGMYCKEFMSSCLLQDLRRTHL